MKLTSAMLADAAQVQSGKLFVLGGGFDTISVRSVPATHRSLSLAMVAEVAPEDRQRDLDLAIKLVDEDGADVGVEAKGRLRVGTPRISRLGPRASCRSSAHFTTSRFLRPRDIRFLSVSTTRNLHASSSGWF